MTLAAVTTLTAVFLWRNHLRGAVEETADAVRREIEREAVEDGLPLERAAPDWIDESENAGFRVEVWKRRTLVAHNTAGKALGPVPAGGPERLDRRWVAAARDMPGGLTVLVAIDSEQGLGGIGLFRRSLAYAIPLCLLLAVAIGAFVGRRAVRPLRDFTDEIVRIRELRSPRLREAADAPAEVRDLERSFRDLLERLRRSVARELEFAGNASHELRTPLTRIRLHAERASVGASPAAREELSEQIREIDKLGRLVDALLVLARDVELGIPAGEGVNLADLVRERTRQVFPEPDRFRLDAPDEAMVRGDEDLLSIAVENLLDNALKYTPAREEADVAVGEERDRVRVAVFSPGAALPEGAEERWFERFVRGEPDGESSDGHGLGLSIARHIAELHRGTLACRGEVRGGREGILFELSLPRWRPASSKSA